MLCSTSGKNKSQGNSVNVWYTSKSPVRNVKFNGASQKDLTCVWQKQRILNLRGLDCCGHF